MSEHESPQITKRPLIFALIFALISIIGGIIMMLSLLSQLNPFAGNSGIITLAVLVFFGILLVVALAIRFFQLAEKSSLDEE